MFHTMHQLQDTHHSTCAALIQRTRLKHVFRFHYLMVWSLCCVQTIHSLMTLANVSVLWPAGWTPTDLNWTLRKFMWCVPPPRRHQLPADQLNVGPVVVASVDSVRDPGLHLNRDMSMGPHHVSCQFMFWRSETIRCIRRSLSREAFAMLVTSFNASKVDYCNVAFAGLAMCELDRIQFVCVCVFTGIYLMFVTIMCFLSLAVTIFIIHVHTRSIAAIPSIIPASVCVFLP